VEDGLPKWEKKRDRKENDFQFFFYGLKRMIRTSIDYKGVLKYLS
jgi:hypothetical protein